MLVVGWRQWNVCEDPVKDYPSRDQGWLVTKLVFLKT